MSLTILNSDPRNNSNNNNTYIIKKIKYKKEGEKYKCHLQILIGFLHILNQKKDKHNLLHARCKQGTRIGLSYLNIFSSLCLLSVPSVAAYNF